jgi:hypothetical protein
MPGSGLIYLPVCLFLDAKQMPYGHGQMFYSYTEDGLPSTGRSDAPLKTFVKMPKSYDATRSIIGTEGLYCQYLALIRHAGCFRVLSAYHAGLGPVSWGSNPRRRLDCLIVKKPGSFVFAQWQGEGGQHFYNHLPGCSKGESNNMSGQQLLDEIDSLPSMHSRAPWEEDYDPEGRGVTSSESDEEEDEEVKRGRYSPGFDPRGLGCYELEQEKFQALAEGGFVLSDKSAHDVHELQVYASVLRMAVADARRHDSSYPCLDFAVEIDYPCTLTHGNDIVDPRPPEEGGEEGSHSRYTSLAQLLKKTCGDNALVGIPAHTMDEATMLKRLMHNPSYSGLVTCEFGYESRDDVISWQQGYCLTKYSCDNNSSEELGPFTLKQTGLESGLSDHLDLTKQVLEKQAKQRELTVLKRSYPTHRLTTMSIDQLRFHVQLRGLRGIRLVMVVLYEQRDYLYPFIEGLLKRRHVLKKQGCPHQKLASGVLKLICNSSYGYYMVRAPDYARSSVCTMDTLHRRLSKFSSDGDGSDPLKDILSCTLLGVVSVDRRKRGRRHRKQPGQTESAEEEEEEGKDADFLFCLTRKCKQQIITNAGHVASTILARSRMIFYSHLIFANACMNIRAYEPVYQDTGKYIYDSKGGGGEGGLICLSLFVLILQIVITSFVIILAWAIMCEAICKTYLNTTALKCTKMKRVRRFKMGKCVLRVCTPEACFVL